MTPLIYEALHTVCEDMAIPDAPNTTTPEAEEIETRGFTTNAQRQAKVTRKELQQMQIVKNTLRRRNAFEFEQGFYRELNAVSNVERLAA